MPGPGLAVGETRIQRKPLCLGISSAKAQHSLGNQSGVCGCYCCWPELVCAARWKIPVWSDGRPLCLREKRGCACGNSLKERDMSVTALPRSRSGESAARCPRRRERAVGLVAGKRSQSRRAGPGRNRGPVASVTRLLCEETEAGLPRRQEGRIGQGIVLHSEEGVWAEGRPVLCLWSQGAAAPWPPVQRAHVGLPPSTRP